MVLQNYVKWKATIGKKILLTCSMMVLCGGVRVFWQPFFSPCHLVTWWLIHLLKQAFWSVLYFMLLQVKKFLNRFSFLIHYRKELSLFQLQEVPPCRSYMLCQTILGSYATNINHMPRSIQVEKKQSLKIIVFNLQFCRLESLCS